MSTTWADLTPSRRCDWIDQLRAWAVIVMIEVHVVNAWLLPGLRPDWLNYLNGLVAPSFLMAAGFSLVVSTFRTDGTLRPFWPDTARRLGFILLCAYALHAPGFTLADWTVLNTVQKARELFKIDILQCIVFSLLVLQVLARLVRNPRVFTFLALVLALYIPLVSPSLWATGVADGLWLPIRGFFNGNVDRGVQALFPLFPWLAFPAFGAFLGGLYRGSASTPPKGNPAGPSGGSWPSWRLMGAVLLAWGGATKHAWLWDGTWVQHGGVWLLHSRHGAWTWDELRAISNTTLPSVADRLGWILLGGTAMGAIELVRPHWRGPEPRAGRQPRIPAALHAPPEPDLRPAAGATGGGPHGLGLEQPGLGRDPDDGRRPHRLQPGRGRLVAADPHHAGPHAEPPAQGRGGAGHLVRGGGLVDVPPLPAKPRAGQGILRLPQRGPGPQGPAPHAGWPLSGSGGVLPRDGRASANPSRPRPGRRPPP